jgi:methylamine dehydrogenase accessory protein MauD
MLIASTFLLWVVVALLIVAVIALARQIETLREGSVQPNAAYGPQAGDLAPMVAGPGIAGGVISVGGRALDGQPSLLLFIAPDCAACRKIVPVAMVLARAEGFRLVFVGDGRGDGYGAMVKRYRMDGFDFALSAQIGKAYRIARLPTAALIAPNGVLGAIGQVDRREDLHNLIVAGKAHADAARAAERSRDADGDDRIASIEAARG